MTLRLPVLNQTDWTRYRPGLERVKDALRRLGEPHQALHICLIGGTNGKGTVAWNLARNLGPDVGLFMSPHVWDIRERITKSGRFFDDHAWLEAYESAQNAGLRDEDLSYFEWLLVLALLMFRGAGLTRAVLEVGLGGRLDATNALEPSLSCVTNVGLDHQAQLGHTIRAIALEKIEIMRPNHPFFCPGTLLQDPVIKERIQRVGPETIAFDCSTTKAENNREIVAHILEKLRHPLSHWSLPPGRRQLIHWNGPVWLDGGHNPMAWLDLAHWFKEQTEPVHLVLALSGSRRSDEVLSILQPLAASTSVLDADYDQRVPLSAWPAHVRPVRIDELAHGPRPLLVTGSLKALGCIPLPVP